jgi:hypothetical protein
VRTGDRLALETRFRFPAETFARQSRAAHHCNGRLYSGDTAIAGSGCQTWIAAGTIYVEFVGEAPAYQTGKRFHVACAEREGLLT